MRSNDACPACDHEFYNSDIAAKDARIAELEAALAGAADMAEMALAIMFEMGEISRGKAVSMIRAALERGER